MICAKTLTPDALRLWRTLRGFTQADAAEWAGVSTRTWRRYETERVPLWVEQRIQHRGGENG